MFPFAQMENRAAGCDPVQLHVVVKDHLTFLSSQGFIEKTTNAIKDLLGSKLGKTPPDGANKSDVEFVHSLQQEFETTSIINFISYATWKKTIKELRELQEAMTTVPCLALHYLHSACVVFEEYKATFGQTIEKSFMETSNNEKRFDSRNGFIKQYLESVAEFIDPPTLEGLIDIALSRSIVVAPAQKAEQHNALTDEAIEASEEDEDGNSVYDGINFQDLSRVNINQVYKYDNKLHFRDTIKQYQGLQQKTIPDFVIEDVKKMIKLQGLESLDGTDKYSRVTKDHIRKFLVATKHNSYYEDVQLIFSRITGKPCPNISSFEPILYKEFDELVEAFKKLKLKRTNFLNCHYVLKQLLKRQRYKVPDGDLPCLKTPNRLREHHGIYQKCCEILGWTFSPN